MLWILLAVPAVSAMLAFALPWNWPRRGLLVATSGAPRSDHPGDARTPAAVLDGWITGLLSSSWQSPRGFFVVSIYAVGYPRTSSRGGDGREVLRRLPGGGFTVACCCSAAADPGDRQSPLGADVGGGRGNHAGQRADLFPRHPGSLVATWKYLVICSVGIALALLGYFFLAVSAEVRELSPIHLTIADLENHARQLDPAWLKAAFLLLLVGYGTKMGLAPLHTWLPDAHSEAPSMVSALLSGVLLNCAFLAILRGHSLLVKAGLGDFSRELLVLFGLVSMVFAAVFVIRQADYKRLLAYSSVEHMESFPRGGSAALPAHGMLHAVNHSLTKAMLFLAAGNRSHFHTKSTLEARGLVRALPVTALVWIAGLLAITGFPRSPFLSELMILRDDRRQPDSRGGRLPRPAGATLAAMAGPLV